MVTSRVSTALPRKLNRSSKLVRLSHQKFQKWPAPLPNDPLSPCSWFSEWSKNTTFNTVVGYFILHELQKVVNWIFFYFLFSFPMCIDMLNEFQRVESFHSTQTGFPLFFNDYQLYFLYQRLHWNKDFPFKNWIHNFFHKVVYKQKLFNHLNMTYVVAGECDRMPFPSKPVF